MIRGAVYLNFNQNIRLNQYIAGGGNEREQHPKDKQEF